MTLQPEIRRPKVERSPKSEVRIQMRAKGNFCAHLAYSEFGFRAPRSAFTLIELILVMAILTMAVSVTAPTLANFFRGRTLDSEARRLLAMTHMGQNRAVSEGVPIDLWIDPNRKMAGLDAEPSYETSDPRAVEFELDSGIAIEIGKRVTVAPAARTTGLGQVASTASVPRVNLTHPELATIRFLPDGTISETSPQKVRLSGRNGVSIWLALAKDNLSYEIRSVEN